MIFNKLLIWYSFHLACLVVLFVGFTVPVVTPTAKTHIVEIRQMEYKPSRLIVARSDTVVFINRDLVTHDVTEETGASWRSPALKAGESWSLVVKQNTNFYCSFHPVMKGKIILK